MTSNESTFTSVLIALLLVSWINDWSPRSMQGTDYRLFCNGAAEKGICKSSETAVEPLNFKLLPDSSIVFWAGDETLYKYTDCVIRDLDNWKCRSEKEPFGPVMADGKLLTHSDSSFYSTNRWKWWALHSRDWFRKKFS